MRRVLSTIIWILIAFPAFSQTITFAWDPHPEAATITGFYLYQSKNAGTYGVTPVATFTPGTLTTGSIPKPTSFGRYYYVLTAYAVDTSVTPNLTLESDHSNEVSVNVKPKSPKIVSAALAVLSAPINAIKWALGSRQQLRVVS